MHLLIYKYIYIFLPFIPKKRNITFEISNVNPKPVELKRITWSSNNLIITYHKRICQNKQDEIQNKKLQQKQGLILEANCRHLFIVSLYLQEAKQESFKIEFTRDMGQEEVEIIKHTVYIYMFF